MYFYSGVLFNVLTYIYTPFYCSFACYASNLDATAEIPDVVRLPGFFVPIFEVQF